METPKFMSVQMIACSLTGGMAMALYPASWACGFLLAGG